MSVLNHLYDVSPVFIQNILITLKNMQVYYNKYGLIPFFQSTKYLQNKLTSSNVEINDDYNLKKINRLINYSRNNCDFFKNNKSYFPLKDIDQLKKIPIIKKGVFKKNIKIFYSDQISTYNSLSFKTSGSTGTPIKGFIKNSDLKKRFLIILKTMIDSGFDFSMPYARFIGKSITNKGPIFRKDYLNNHFFFSIHHLSKKTINQYYLTIVKNNIMFIEGYPSTINNLVNLLKSNNLKISCVKGVFLTAEKLNDIEKNNIEEYFGCNVFDYYGSNEQSIYIYKSFHENKYVCCNKTGYLEVINENGDYVSEGEEGRMIVTSFTSHFTPLIRYEIGDRCHVKKINILSDGSIQYELSEIIGREEQSFFTIDGRIVSRFSLVLKHLPKKINQSQLFLSEKTINVIVKYVYHEVIDNREFLIFEKYISKFLGEGYNYIYQRIDKVQLQKSGKVKTVFIENK